MVNTFNYSGVTHYRKNMYIDRKFYVNRYVFSRTVLQVFKEILVLHEQDLITKLFKKKSSQVAKTRRIFCLSRSENSSKPSVPDSLIKNIFF